MTDDVQPPEPPILLLDVSRRVAAPWLRRVTAAAARRGGVDVTAESDALDELAERAAATLVAELADLLATDVDDQRTTPLTVFRQAVREPTAWLRARGVPPPASIDGPPGDDVYGLGPATWSDVDPDLHEPGLTWGAWKAMTVLRRRRDDGLR